jgi:copper chaperone CopZ
MKQITISVMMIMMLTFITRSVSAQSKTTQTDTLTISGNCSQCKQRIEDAAYVKGVKSAVWNTQTKVLTVVYNAEKTDMDKIAAAVAKAGHDSRKHTSADKDYKKLPACCAYRSGACHHE